MHNFKNHPSQFPWKMQRNKKIVTGITKKHKMSRKCDTDFQIRFQTNHTKRGN